MEFFRELTQKQKWIIVTPMVLSVIYSLFVFFTTAAGSEELADTAQKMLNTMSLQYFFLVLFMNFIPAFVLSLLLWIYALNNPYVERSMQWLLACGLIGGIFPVVWFYWIYYFSEDLLYPIAIALYGLPAGFFIGMLMGYTIGRIIIGQFPHLFGD